MDYLHIDPNAPAGARRKYAATASALDYHLRKRKFNSALIIDAAMRHGLSVERIEGFSYIVSGDGKSVFFRKQMVGEISFGAVTVATSKSLTKQILKRRGIPTPQARRFEKHQKRKAIEYFEEFGSNRFVMKPTNSAYGNGVYTNVCSKEDFEEAWGTISEKWGPVIMEEFVPGVECRYFVLGSKVAAVTNRLPAHVVGDGINSIAGLIIQKNNEARMRNVALKSLPDDNISNQILKDQGLTKESIPEIGKVVHLRMVSNISQGGDSVDVTDNVDDSLKNLAVSAVSAIPGLLYAGLDMIAENHFRPLHKQKAYILEINIYPMLSMHHFPAYGQSRNVADELVRSIFYDGSSVDPSCCPFDGDRFLARAWDQCRGSADSPLPDLFEG